jgi:hypothetical protein
MDSWLLLLNPDLQLDSMKLSVGKKTSLLTITLYATFEVVPPLFIEDGKV